MFTIHRELPLLHPFNGLFSRTTWVSRYQKGQTSMDWKWGKRWWGFGMEVVSAGPYAINLPLAPDRRPHQHLITQLLQAGCFSWHPTNSVDALKAILLHWEIGACSRIETRCLTVDVDSGKIHSLGKVEEGSALPLVLKDTGIWFQCESSLCDPFSHFEVGLHCRNIYIFLEYFS